MSNCDSYQALTWGWAFFNCAQPAREQGGKKTPNIKKQREEINTLYEPLCSAPSRVGPAYGASAELGGRCSRSRELKYPLAVESQFYGQGSEQRGGICALLGNAKNPGPRASCVKAAPLGQAAHRNLRAPPAHVESLF